MGLTLSDPKALLTRAFESALRAAAPSVCLNRALDELGARAPAVVLGAGKAAAAMAAAFAASWGSPVRGLVVTRYGHGLIPGEDSGGIEIVEAGHPSPDEASLAAGARLLDLARRVAPGEKLVGLISGGGSSLASAPIDGLAFEQKRDAANFLIRAGADIREINCVRKHLSGLKGGRLAAAARPAEVLTFAISDVPGDDPADIASGPTIADRTTQRDALAILTGYRYPRIDALRAVLEDPRFETPKPDDPAFGRDTVRVVASNATALDAAEAFLTEQGIKVVRLGDDLDGEAEALGREHARLALELARSGEPVAILSGGETRVVLAGAGSGDRSGHGSGDGSGHGSGDGSGHGNGDVSGDGSREGRGGRNLEYLSGLALELAGAPGVFGLAADTDGIDGNGDHAGGLVAPDMLTRGAALGLSLEALLARHDSYRFFDACNLLLRTGPTRTNVNDFRLIISRSHHQGFA